MSDSEFEFKINTKFAEEYEQRKKDEDLHAIREEFQGEAIDEERLEKILERKRRYGMDKSVGFQGVNIKVDDDSEDSESEIEDEQAALITPEVDSQILKTLVLLKTKNADIYDPTKKFFDEKTLEVAREKLQKKRKEELESAPITLKSLQQERFSKGFVEDLGEEEVKEEVEEPVLSLDHEQRKIKQELKLAANDQEDESDDELFVKRKRTDEEQLEEAEDYRLFLLQEAAKVDVSKKVVGQWENYKDNPNINGDDAFLMDYVLKRGWIDKDVGKVPTYDEIVADIDEDEHLDKADEFEREYNFRFEEPGSSQISTYPRIIPGLIREAKSKRSIARSNRNKRKKAEKQAEEEQLKRQKNEKMAEFNNKMQELSRLTGGKVNIKDIEAALDADFDPATFGAELDSEGYSDDGDDEKPVFDDIDIGHIEEQQTPEEAEKVKSAAKKLLEDYYKLDREDKIDDLNTRFKYNRVEKDTGGLTFTDIILADDKDLNQVMPMAALAPFRDTSKPFKPKSSKIKYLREKLVEDGLIAPSSDSEEKSSNKEKSNKHDKSSKKEKSSKSDKSLKKEKSSKSYKASKKEKSSKSDKPTQQEDPPKKKHKSKK